jgi:hypothetical protein
VWLFVVVFASPWRFMCCVSTPVERHAQLTYLSECHFFVVCVCVSLLVFQSHLSSRFTSFFRWFVLLVCSYACVSTLSLHYFRSAFLRVLLLVAVVTSGRLSRGCARRRYDPCPPFFFLVLFFASTSYVVLLACSIPFNVTASSPTCFASVVFTSCGFLFKSCSFVRRRKHHP